MSNWAN